MKKLILAAGFAAIAALSASPAAACEEVTITEMNWASSQIVTSVAKFIMEQGYGCTVTTVPSSTVNAVASMAETNKPDIATEVWVNSAAIYPKLVEDGKVVTLGNVLSDGGEENWWIPAYLAEEYPELKTIEGVLANPELVGGMFHNCPVGWGCRIANDNLKVAFDFAGAGMDVFDHGSGETLATSLATAYSEKAPWFGYYWAPTSVLGKYDMVAVDMGPYDAEIHTCNQQDDCATPQKSSYPAAPVLTSATTTFAEREPEVAEMMSKLTFTNKQMGSVLAWQEDNGASAEEAAVHYLTTYNDVWGDWLNDEAREKLAAILK